MSLPVKTVVARFAKAAQIMAESATGYQQMLDDYAGDRPKIEIGGFYSTYNGSTVYIARRDQKCTCPTCQTRLVGLQFLLSLTGADVPEATHAQEYAKGPPVYVAVVIKGGHGLKDVVGEEPGDGYKVDQEGLIVGLPDVEDHDCDLRAVHLAMVGLCLKKRLKVEIKE